MYLFIQMALYRNCDCRRRFFGFFPNWLTNHGHLLCLFKLWISFLHRVSHCDQNACASDVELQQQSSKDTNKIQEKRTPPPSTLSAGTTAIDAMVPAHVPPNMSLDALQIPQIIVTTLDDDSGKMLCCKRPTVKWVVWGWFAMWDRDRKPFQEWRNCSS